MVYNFEGNPPQIEWHIVDPDKDSEAAWKEWNSYSDNDDPYCVGWKLLTVSLFFHASKKYFLIILKSLTWKESNVFYITYNKLFSQTKNDPMEFLMFGLLLFLVNYS